MFAFEPLFWTCIGFCSDYGLQFTCMWYIKVHVHVYVVYVHFMHV